MLASNKEESDALAAHAQEQVDLVHAVFDEYDVKHIGELKEEKAKQLFKALALELLRAAADRGNGAAASHAKQLLGTDGDFEAAECEAAVEEMAEHLLHLADRDANGVVSVDDLVQLFSGSLAHVGTELTAPKELELLELRGCLQLLPRVARHFDGAALEHDWHTRVPGDSHTLLRWVAPTYDRDQLSIVGLGRSADASCYYLPEWGMVLDAGLAAKSLSPKTVLLTHGHRDHVQALPAMARPPFSQSTPPPKILLPAPLEPLVRQFLLAESQLNFGKPQTEEENYAALGQFDLLSCADGDVVELPKHAYLGRDGLCVEALRATHKDMPALSYGIFRKTKKLKPEFAAQRHRIKQLLKESPGIELTEIVNERLLFYTGDTTIELLEQHAAHILSYKYIVHECSFLGPPSKKLDQYALQRGHTHYAQLHPYICSAPNTTFILVHWSIRYSREDVEAFFEEQYGGVPENVVLWI